MYYESDGFYLTDKFDAIKEQSKKKIGKNAISYMQKAMIY